VYRFVLTPRWIGLGLLMVLAAATMVGLGLWQLDRFHLRSDINARIDAAGDAAPRPLAAVVPTPIGAPPGTAGQAPTKQATWSRVTVTGRYDTAHELLARARTVNGNVGFEVLTPLRLADGTAVLIDRGWVPPARGGAAVLPEIPAAPPGPVTVVGRVHAPESRAGAPEPYAGLLAVRRIAPQKVAAGLPYPLYGAFVTLESQTPPADRNFVPIAPDHENAAMNAGYVVQWWALAGLTLTGFVYLVVRRARDSVALPLDLTDLPMLADAPVSPAV
jgi:cytochrome oxidase assembly protein ShyY1